MAVNRSVKVQIKLEAGEASARLGKFSDEFRGLERNAGRLKSLGTGLSLGLTAPLTALGAVTFNAAKELDSLERGLTAVAGSSAAAKRQMAELREVAKLPGLGFKEAIEGSINLQAAGLSADFAKRSLSAFGNALVTVGKGKAELSGVNLALTQIANNEFLQGDELNQLRERVPQISKLLKEAFGTVDTEKLKKAGITSKQVLETIVSQLEKLPKVTSGAQTDVENLADAYDQSMAQLGNATLKVALPAIKQLTPAVERLGNRFAALSPETQETTVKVLAAAAAMGPLSYGAGKAVEGVASFTKTVGAARLALGSASAGTGFLGALAGVNPAFLIAGGAAAAAGVLWYEYARRTDEAATMIENSAKRARGAVELLNGEKTTRATLGDGSQVDIVPGREMSIDPSLTRKSTIKGNQGFVPTGPDGRPFGASLKPPKLRTLLEGEGRGGGKGVGKGGGKPGAATNNELTRLNEQVKDLTRELGVLRNATSDEFQLKLQITGLETGKSAIEELLQLQAEAGLQADVPQFAVKTRRGVRKLTDFARVRENAGRLRGDYGIEAPDLGGLNTASFEIALEVESQRLEKQGKVLEAQADVAESLVSTAQALREELAAQGDPTATGRAARDLARRGVGSDNQEGGAILAAARALDAQEEYQKAQEEYQKAVDESTRANEQFRRSVESLFESLLDSPRKFFDQLKGMAKNFASSTLSSLLLGNGEGAGGKGGGFSFGGGKNGGGLLGNLLSFRTPGFNPAVASAGGSAGGGGFLSQLTGGGNGVLGGLATKGVGFLGKLFGLGGSGGASTAASGAVSAAKAALGIGGSAAGGAAGAAGGAAGASGGFLSSLAPLLTNPFTIAAAGAAIGGFFLYRSLRNRDLKKLRELARGQYGVDVKDDSTLKAVREIGKSTFGKEYDKRLAETVALPTVKDLIAQYAENTGQGGNGSLISRARLGDKFDPVNLVKREFGGPVAAGQAYLVGERRPELFVPRQSGTIVPDAGGGGGEMMAAVLGMMARMHATLQQWTPKSPNDVLMAADPRTHAEVTRSGFNADYGLVNDLAYQVNR